MAYSALAWRREFMGGNKYPWGIGVGIAVLISASDLSTVWASAPASVTLPGSIGPVDSSPSTGPTPRPFISRRALTSAETTAPLVFEVALKMRNFAKLQARIHLGEHIPPAEMAAKYEPSATDYQAVVDWAKGQGFTIVRQDSHHMALFVRGKIGHIAQALKVGFSRVTFEGKEYSSAVSAPSVPSNISPLLVGINGLQPHLHAHKHIIKQQAQPNGTGGTSQYIPSQIAQAYKATALYNNDITGAGQTIAIVIDTFPSTTDLRLFWKNCGVNRSLGNIEFVQAVPGALDPLSGEETLDVEWASSMAPGAHVRVYASADLGNADLDQAYQAVYDDVTNHPEYGIHQMSMSYGEGETYLETTINPPQSAQVQTDDQFFAELAAAGVTEFASSGDGDATPGSGSAGDKTGPVQVESPASDPNVTGVGGTSLVLDSSNNVTSEVVWNNTSGGSGGGASIYFAQPTWQTGTGVNANAMRQVPDIAATADPNHGAVMYYGGVQTVEGGTSWSSPTCAALCALINQARANAGQPPLGLLGPSIYPLLNSPNYASNFRDIVSGNNGTRVNAGFSAQTGYDAVTGIGAPLAQVLAQTLVGSSNLVGVLMPPTQVSGTPGEDQTFSVAVNGTSATYQWQRMAIGTTTWTNLGDDSTFTGSTAATLSVTNPGTSMNGDQYRCVITLSGNVVTTSTPSVLVVDTPWKITTFAGTAGTAGINNATGTAATFNYPSGVAFDGSDNLFVADFSNNVIREVTSAGVVSTPYGNPAGTAGKGDGAGNSASFTQPNGVAFDAAGFLYVADTGNNLIRQIASGSVNTMAGGSGQLAAPGSLAVDGSGNIFVADTNNHVIRKVSPNGTISTVAGQLGMPGYLDGDAITQALFNAPSGVALDSLGNIYVTDFGNCVVRKITLIPGDGGTVTTVAGQGRISGFRDGPGVSALFSSPVGIAIDGSDNLYITDALVPPLGSNAGGNNALRKITPAGVVSTLAGDPGNEGTADGTGSAAQFFSLQAIAFDSGGTAYLADTYNQTIRQGVPLAAPVIALAATQSNAVVFSSTTGQITLTRTGDTTNSLDVIYTAAGTAVSGTDYAALSGIVTIPAGATSAVITVNPISDPQATSPTVQLTLSASAAYVAGSPNTATVTIVEPTPHQAWKMAEFGASASDPSIAGDTADPNQNGVPNLLEYAFHSDPLQTGTEPLPVTSVVNVNGQDYLAITFTQLNNDPSLTYTVQVTADLTQQTDPWHSGTTFVSQTVNGNTTQVTVRDNTALLPGVPRFIRVQVTGN